jgi:mono/diheme cytochrome c family protein
MTMRPGDARACPRTLVWGLVVLCVAGLVRASAAGDQAGGQGKTIYETQCAVCHGPRGGGDGPAAAALQPKPRDLSAGKFWSGRTPASVAATIRDGRPGTAMIGYKSILRPEEIDSVVIYLRSLAGLAAQ